MSLLLCEDASSILAKYLSRKPDPLYDRWISLWGTRCFGYCTDGIISRTYRILYPIFLYRVVSLREREGSEGVVKYKSLLYIFLQNHNFCCFVNKNL